MICLLYSRCSQSFLNFPTFPTSKIYPKYLDNFPRLPACTQVLFNFLISLTNPLSLLSLLSFFPFYLHPQPARALAGRQPDQRGARGGGLAQPAAGAGALRQPDRAPADEYCAPEEPQVAAAAQESPAPPAQGHCCTEESD